MADPCNIKELINTWIDEADKLVNDSVLCQRRELAGKSDQEVSIRIWTELPYDTLELVIRAIYRSKDYLKLIGACKKWRIFAREIMFSPRSNLPLLNPLPKKYTFPMLLQPHAQDSEVCYFYSIIKGKVHKIHVPELSNKWIIGSWRGWLATIDYHDVNQIRLLNPITKAQITLPPLSTLPEPITCSLNFQKIVVVSPNKVDVQSKLSNCVIVALITEEGFLHFCRIGDDRWEKIYPSIHCITDVIEFKGLLYAVDDRGNLFVVETSPFTKLTPVAVNLNCHGDDDRLYLVESSGDLLFLEI
ncbi:F-box protein skip23 [Rhynchospora pubera]|uniref:F-box protein skip23 n=1 Tax=Rhynchospora pubera TaxID=906938 RepID=A0AAV8EJG3_9POAL|nr:F-box protein skip23 [Rhynchospora pubera]